MVEAAIQYVDRCHFATANILAALVAEKRAAGFH